MEEEKNKEKKERYIVQEISTGSKPVIVDTEAKDEKDKYFDTEEMLVKIANNVEVIKKVLSS